MSCCNCTYQIAGCYNVCEDIELTLEGLADGTYTVNAGFYSFTAEALDEVLTIPANTLNESECVELKIEGYTLDVDGNSYDCFRIKTKYELTASNFVPSDGGGVTPPNVDFCQRVQDCMAGFTPEQPAVQAPATVLIQNTTYNLQGFMLDFIGNEVDGNQLYRGFDPNGNDIGGIQGTNVIGIDNTFNSILGAGNTIGDGNSLNTIIGGDNTLGNDNTGCLLLASDATVGDSNNYIFLFGQNHSVGNNINYAFAFGDGHDVTNEQSYYFGRYSDAITGGIALGNGTSNVNRSNAFEALLNGTLKHSGAYANKPTRYTAGGSHTIPDNVSVYIYDPGSIQAGATITLPANPIDGQDLYIIGGGTITSGNVITGFTLDGNGRTVIGDGAANLKVGKAYELHYVAENNIWYAIAF